MKTRLVNQDQLLNDSILRRTIIEEINGEEEYARRSEAYRKYLMLRGQNKPYIKGMLASTYSPETMKKLEYAMTNIAINTKIITKLAKVYENGATRAIASENSINEKETAKVQNLASWLDFNSIMKTANQSMRQQNKITVFTRPYSIDGVDYVAPMPLEPYMFSVIEHKENRKIPMCYILSDFKLMGKGNGDQYTLQDNPRKALNKIDKRYDKGDYYQKVATDGKDNIIADSPLDQADCPQHYYFWTKSYHFVCNINGEILSKENLSAYADGKPVDPVDYINPISSLPFDDLGMNQDNTYWPVQVNNVPDMDILLNCSMTNLNHIGNVQGYGKFYMKGSNLPEHIPQAPDLALKLEYDEGDPVPEIGYVNSNPNLSELRANIEMQLAILLSTNNLSVSSFKLNLQGDSVQSGLAKILDSAESTEDINDQRQIFYDKEPLIWEKIHAWLDLLNRNGNLAKELKDNIFNLETFKKGFMLTFPPHKPIVSESEHLGNLKLRKELALNTKAEIIMMDRLGVDEKQAVMIVDKIKKERLEDSKIILDDENENSDKDEIIPDDQEENKGSSNEKE